MTVTPDNLRGVCLRQLRDLPDHVFSQLPIRLIGGNETTIYAFHFDVPPSHFCSGPLILRIFDSAISHPKQYRWEAVTHDVLRNSGYPIPGILAAGVDPDIGAFVIMERLEGIMMGSDGLKMPGGLLHFPGIFRNLPADLAELHLQLHGLNPQPLHDELTKLDIAADAFTSEWQIERIRFLIPPNWSTALKACDKLLEQLPATVDARMCHGDFHPLNVMTSKGRITGVIDWSKVRFADREYDLANAHLLLQASVLVLPGWVTPVVNELKRRMAERFLKHYARQQNIDRAKLAYFRALRALEELVLARLGFAPQMGEVGGWNMDFLGAVLTEQTGINL